MRVFFATDIHGSEVCWRKFLNAGKFHKADVLIMGGDMTGKAMVPIVANGSNWELELQGQRHVLTTEDELRGDGEADQRPRLLPGPADTRRGRRLGRRRRPSSTRGSRRRCSANVERWMALGDERLAGTGIRCIVSPANDDMFEIDPIIERAEHLELGEANTIELDGFTLDLDRLGQPDAVEHVPRAARARAPRADRRAGRARSPTRTGRSSTSTRRRTARTSTTRPSSMPT